MDTPGPAFVLMYNNSTSSVSLVCDPSHNIISPTDLSNNSPSLNNHGIPFYGLHWETSVILWVWHYLGHSQLAHQAGDLYPCPWYYHVHRLSTSIRPSCVFQTQHSFPCCYGTLWTLTFFFFFYLFFLILFLFLFLFFFLVTMKKHVISQSHNMSHYVTL